MGPRHQSFELGVIGAETENSHVQRLVSVCVCTSTSALSQRQQLKAKEKAAL